MNWAVCLSIPRMSRSSTGFTQEFTNESTDYAEVCREKKHLVLRDLLGSDVNRLTALLTDIFQLHRSRQGITRGGMPPG